MENKYQQCLVTFDSKNNSIETRIATQQYKGTNDEDAALFTQCFNNNTQNTFCSNYSAHDSINCQLKSKKIQQFGHHLQIENPRSGPDGKPQTLRSKLGPGNLVGHQAEGDMFQTPMGQLFTLCQFGLSILRRLYQTNMGYCVCRCGKWQQSRS